MDYLCLRRDTHEVASRGGLHRCDSDVGRHISVDWRGSHCHVASNASPSGHIVINGSELPVAGLV